MRKLDSLLLAGVGIMAIHQVAYTVAGLTGANTSVGHGHLELAWTFGSLLAILGLGSAITTSLRRRHHTPLGVPLLSIVLGVGYVGLEMVERSLDGLSATALFSEAVFWFGLAAVVPVAMLLRAAVRTVTELVLQLTAATDGRLPSIGFVDPARFGRTRRTPILLPVRSRPVSRRGPPSVR